MADSDSQSSNKPAPGLSTNVERSRGEPPPPAFRDGMPPALVAIFVAFGLAIVAVIVSIALFKPPG